MRYYNIVVTGATSVFPARYDGGAQWGTTINGIHDPNAQQIEFQITAYDATTPTENSVLTIYGVSWDQIKNCNQLVGCGITINGGMSPGLPLATFQSQRPKKILEGTIFKCWGNWIGNETSIGIAFAPAGLGSSNQNSSSSSSPDSTSSSTSSDAAPSTQGALRVTRTGLRSIDSRSLGRGRPSIDSRLSVPSLGIDPATVISQIGGTIITDFQIGPATSQIGGMFSSFFGGGNISPLSEPLNIIHNLMPNMPLSGAIQETLSKAFPKANLNIKISDILKLAYQDAGIHQSLEQYAGYINNLSQSIFGTKNYPGIHITSVSNTIDVWDQPLDNTDISYLELVGQPTWIAPATVSVKIVLRGGLKLGDTITLPQTLVGFSGADAMLGSNAPDQRTHVSLPGTYQISKLMHIGDFRNPDGANWTTNIEAVGSAAVSGATPQAVEQGPANPSGIVTNLGPLSDLSIPPDQVIPPSRMIRRRT